MEDDIGYKKPPKHSRFKPGMSGNPKGRPRGTSNFKTDVKKALNSEVWLTRDGRRKRVSAQEAALLRLFEKGLNGGNIRALLSMLQLGQTHNNDETPSQTEDALDANEASIFENFKQRLLRHHDTAAPAANAPPSTASARDEEHSLK